MKKTVIYHSADFDGIFCREIAKHFLGEKDVNYLGWNFGDRPLMAIFPEDQEAIYVLDLPVDKVFGFNPEKMPEFVFQNLTWIDHHKTSIESHPKKIPGYRIDGVAACRLSWQWFSRIHASDASGPDPLPLPFKQDFIDRKVSEPLAVQLAGEYDIWDRRNPWAGLFQYGLRSVEPDWNLLLGDGKDTKDDEYVLSLVNTGETSQRYAQTVDSGNMKASFILEWEGLKFLCLNGRGNSLTFASRDVPETGHDALLMFYTNGTEWIVSLYHSAHNTGIDLSVIAKKWGGGGHKGACGFQCVKLPF